MRAVRQYSQCDRLNTHPHESYTRAGAGFDLVNCLDVTVGSGCRIGCLPGWAPASVTYSGPADARGTSASSSSSDHEDHGYVSAYGGLRDRNRTAVFFCDAAGAQDAHLAGVSDLQRALVNPLNVELNDGGTTADESTWEGALLSFAPERASRVPTGPGEVNWADSSSFTCVALQCELGINVHGASVVGATTASSLRVDTFDRAFGWDCASPL